MAFLLQHFRIPARRVLLVAQQRIQAANYHEKVRHFLMTQALAHFYCPLSKVIDHYENPRNVGSLDKNDSSVGTGLVGAPACGDVMKLQVINKLYSNSVATRYVIIITEGCLLSVVLNQTK